MPQPELANESRAAAIVRSLCLSPGNRIVKLPKLVALFSSNRLNTRSNTRTNTRTTATMATASKAKKKTVRLASGRKRARQDVKLNAANTALRSRFRTVVKNVQKAVLTGDKAKAADLFKTAESVIDSVTDKGIFHKNKAARHKSRLSAKIKALAAPADTAPAAA